MTAQVMRNLATFRRVPPRLVLGGAAASALLLVGMWALGQPLYIIALFALLPWLPIILFESLWKVEHYNWIAIFAVLAFLQVAHLGEHVIQVTQIGLASGTKVCPPPVDTPENAARAVAAGLRSPDVPATNFSASLVVMPSTDGIELMDPFGNYIVGPVGCGVFGQLDIEIVHLIWGEIIGWLMTLLLLLKFPRSRWLWFALIWVVIHATEHLFISYTYFIDREAVFSGTQQIWATLAEGNIVTAYPLGKEPALVPFYDVAGKFGIAARYGLLGSLFPQINLYLPERHYLHFFYNTLVTIPTVIGFVMVAREMYDKYLALALPRLSKKQLIAATPALVPQTFRAGETIIRQGDMADTFYVLTRGIVEVIDEHAVTARQLARLERGQFFGEMAFLQGGPRTATVRAVTDVEVMKLDYAAFADLMAESEVSRRDIEAMAARRALALATS